MEFTAIRKIFSEHKSEYSKQDERLKYLGPNIESHGPKESTPKPNTYVHDVNQNIIKIGKMDEILNSVWKSARVAKTYRYVLQKRSRQLPQALQTRLDERYSGLFNYEPDPLTKEEKR